MSDRHPAQEGLPENDSVPEDIASHSAERSEGTAALQDSSEYNINKLNNTHPIKLESKSFGHSEATRYFADGSQTTIEPSESSIISTLRSENAELRKQVVRYKNSSKQWQTQIESYNTRKDGWTAVFQKFHKDILEDLEQFGGGFERRGCHLNEVNQNQRSTCDDIKIATSLLKVLLNAEAESPYFRIAPDLPILLSKYKDNITEMWEQTEPLLREAWVLKDVTAAEKARILDVIINRIISGKLMNELEALKTNIMGFFGRDDIEPMKPTSRPMLSDYDLKEAITGMQGQLSLYTGDCSEIISHPIEKRQVDILAHVRKGIKKLVDAEIDMNVEIPAEAESSP
ncbi:hypothetical protein BKA65DRAFT_587374 [Rhexocercosporidium sp. MPI-PUGE-AT-0058]|nr:hypothetical protein BKA65DRAFT_587374 [Rhexocercosporidium sp. MPI-PUGE-AT-0058]